MLCKSLFVIHVRVKVAMHHICYYYEFIQVLNDNIMFIYKILHFNMKLFSLWRMIFYELMAMCDSIYEQQ